MQKKRKPVINTHCHLLNLDFIPGKMIKLLTPLTHNLAKDDSFRMVADILSTFIPGDEYDRIDKFLKNYSSDINKVTKKYMTQLKYTGIDICVPLMMDFEQAIPDSKTKNIAYYIYDKQAKQQQNLKDQVDYISRQVAKYPWQIFPFIMFDPRRKDSFEICRKAIEKKGFIGIKMYPALGYHPSPYVMRSPGSYWGKYIKKDDLAADQLDRLYTYCKNNRIPITTHIDIEGAYSSDKLGNSPWFISDIEKFMELDKVREREVWPLTEVSNWMVPLQEYNLKINFAHLGGNYLHNKDLNRLQASTWRRQILNMIANSQIEKNGAGSVYTDLSYHYMALKDNSHEQVQYFKDLNNIMKDKIYRSRLLFGTDASMISHSWSEGDYIRPYKNSANLDKKYQEKIFSDNPTSFLFENAKIPQTYVSFLKKKNGPYLELPEWIVKKDDAYYIVTNKDIVDT